MSVTRTNLDVGDLVYYPGCTLKNTARPLESAFLAVCRALDVEIPELERWNCCGTVFSLAADTLINHVGSVRNLIRAKQMGRRGVVAPCSVCYNTLMQVVLFLRDNPDLKRRIDLFLDDEPVQFDFDVDVLDLVRFLRDVVGFERIKEAQTRPLDGLRVAMYYGCLHSRPREAGTVALERPVDVENLLGVLGADVVRFARSTDCCGSYLRVKDPAATAGRVGLLLSSAAAAGATVLVTICPLCHHNLDSGQVEARGMGGGPPEMPVLYLPQLLALALGEAPETCMFERHAVDPVPALAALVG